MATKPKPQGEPRRDASGRELFDWEVDPADQVTRRAPEAEQVGSAPGGTAEQDDAEGGQ